MNNYKTISKSYERLSEENDLLLYTLRNIICIMNNDSKYYVNKMNEIEQKPSEDFSIPFFERYIKNIICMCEDNKKIDYDIRSEFDYINENCNNEITWASIDDKFLVSNEDMGITIPSKDINIVN